MLLAGVAKATEQFGDTIRPPRPKVGVALGGGGAKGAAHIGVLKYIEEMGIPIDYVAGTSMGSIIGGLYAVGYSPDELAVLIANMNWSAYVGNSINRSAMSPEMRQRNSTMFMNIPFSLEGLLKNKSKSISSYLPSAYVNNTALINLFNDLCIGYQEDINFNELPIPFACVATDIATGKEVVIRHGSVPTAMRASMAIPGVFSPVMMDGKVLVDGGLVNNFPADVLRNMGADIIIGVEVSDKLESNLDEVPSLPNVFNYLITNAVSSKREENKKLCTLYLDPDITGYGTLSFTPDAIDTLVRRGYEKASQCHDQLLRIKQYVDKEAGYHVNKHLQAPKAKNLDDHPIFVSAITMNMDELKLGQGDWLAKKGGLNVGEFISAQDIDHAVDIYRGTGAFNNITYNIYESKVKIPEKAPVTYQLVLNLKPTQPHVVGIGSRYDTEEGAAMLINLGINEKRLSGYKLNLSGRLSYNPRFNMTATYSWIPVANFNLAYDYRSQHFKVMVHDQRKNTNLHYSQHQFSASISQFQMLNVNSLIGFAYIDTHFDQAYFDINTYDTTGLTIVHSPAFNDNRLFGTFVNFEYDNLDNSYFACQGIRTRFNASLHLDTKNGATAKGIGLSFESYFSPKNGRFTVIPQLYSRLALGCSPYANLRNAIGGDIPGRHVDQQMPFIGVSHLNEASDFASILRCDLRYHFLEKHYLTGICNFLFGYNFPNAGKASYTEFYTGVGLRYAYSSPIGPIALTAQWSNCTNQFSMYFSLGYNF
jgi:NTE family protein